MQLEVKYQELKPVESNFEALKIELDQQLDKYQNLVVIETNIPKYKVDRANLNKLKKALNDEKIKVKKEFTAPIVEFEAKVKELIAMIDEPTKCLDEQLKKFESQKKEEKKAQIVAYFNEQNKTPEYKIEMIFDDTWLNKVTSLNSVKGEIDDLLNEVYGKIEVIKGFKSEFEKQLMDLYLKCFSFMDVFKEKTRLDALKKQIEEKQKADKEAKEAKEESERLKKEDEMKKPEPREYGILPDRPGYTNLTKEKKEEPKEEIKLDKKSKSELSVDFRVWGTKVQLISIKEFLINNNIKFGGVS